MPAAGQVLFQVLHSYWFIPPMQHRDVVTLINYHLQSDKKAESQRGELVTQVCLPRGWQRQDLNSEVWFQTLHKQLTWACSPVRVRTQEGIKLGEPVPLPSSLSPAAWLYFFLSFHVCVCLAWIICWKIFLKNYLICDSWAFFYFWDFIIWIFQNG